VKLSSSHHKMHFRARLEKTWFGLMKAAFWIYPTKIKILLECQRAATLPEAQCVTRLSFARASGRVRWKASWFSLWFTLWRYPVKNKEIMRRGKNKSAAEILSASWKQLVKPQSLFWTGKWLKKTQLWLWACSNNLPPTCRRTRGQASLHTSLLSLRFHLQPSGYKSRVYVYLLVHSDITLLLKVK